MRKHLITLGIWLVAALALLLIYWSPALETSASLVTASPTSVAATADPQRGKALFMAKGCANCHSHAAAIVGSGSINIGPSLTYYRADPAFLQRWLRDPQAIRPGTQMPNLNLKQEEIDALIAFLSMNQQQP